ncbi:hypothetical protein CDIK_0596 [Cucumispora dikerogammari]|nr:hypothetical protein CDIK_0596 [Cucumispora dikerogammari]
MKLKNKEIRTLGTNRTNCKILIGTTDGDVLICSLNDQRILTIDKTIPTKIDALKCYNSETQTFGSVSGQIFRLDSCSSEETYNYKTTKLTNSYLACLTKYGKNIAVASWDQYIRFFNPAYKEISSIGIASWWMKSIEINIKYYDNEISLVTLLVSDYKGGFNLIFQNKVIFNIKIHAGCIRSFDSQEKISIILKEFYDEKRTRQHVIKAAMLIKIVSVSNEGQILLHTLDSVSAHVNVKLLSYKVLMNNNRICCLCDENALFLFNDKLENKITLRSKNSTIWDGVFFGSQLIIIGGSSGYLEGIDLESNKLISLTDLEEEFEEEITEHKHYVIKGNRIFSKDGEYIGEKEETNKQFIFEPPVLKKFSIELKGNYLPISFMTDEDPQAVASRFLMEHKLSTGFQQEIVNFINEHFKRNTSANFMGVELFTGINIDGIKNKLMGFDVDIVFELLYRCTENNTSKYEIFRDLPDVVVIDYAAVTLRETYDKIEDGEKYPIMDIVRYLALFKGINIDYLYFTGLYNKFLNIKGDKEVSALIRLIVNLYPRKLLNMEVFDSFVKSVHVAGSIYDKYTIIRDKVLNE